MSYDLERAVQDAVFKGLSDSLQCCIDTGNKTAAHALLVAAAGADIRMEHQAELQVDFDQAFEDQ